MSEFIVPIVLCCSRLSHIAYILLAFSNEINASISDTQTGAVSAHFLDCVRMYYERSMAGVEVNVFLSKDNDEE